MASNVISPEGRTPATPIYVTVLRHITSIGREPTKCLLRLKMSEACASSTLTLTDLLHTVDIHIPPRGRAGSTHDPFYLKSELTPQGRTGRNTFKGVFYCGWPVVSALACGHQVECKVSPIILYHYLIRFNRDPSLALHSLRQNESIDRRAPEGKPQTVIRPASLL